jgi:hypothetical protein
MSTFLGFDVLDILPPSREGTIPDQIDRRMMLLDYGPGAEWLDEQSDMPNPMRPFKWIARSRDEAALMRTFILARKGMAVPFWLPTYQSDLTLSEDLGSGASGAHIVWCGYSNQMYVKGGARRYVALLAPGGSLDCYHITGASDPNDGTPEALGISPSASKTYAAASTMVMFLRLCRLDSDDVDVTWYNPDAAECTLQAREIPMEAAL